MGGTPNPVDFDLEIRSDILNYNHNVSWNQLKPTDSSTDEQPRPKIEDYLTKMEDDLTQKGRQPHPKLKTTSLKMEDDLTQNGRRPKNENDQK